MREIKFRCFYNGQWYYIDFNKDNLNHAFKHYENHRTSKLYEYTGLKDKNSKEIYEGDIVDFDNIKEPYYIAFERGFFQTKNKDGVSGYHGIWNFNNRIEILGNIYENPELLEQK